MYLDALHWYREVWTVDFEFIVSPGERPIVVCCVARELRSGRLLRVWQDQLGLGPPYPTDAGVLFVAYYASAELGCHLALGWPCPERVLDLYAEFRCLVNGSETPSGAGLVGALVYFGLDAISAAEKGEMRTLIMEGGPWSEHERCDILDYCQSDVDALGRLLTRMLPRIDLPRALLRGRYMAAAARMERVGVPIDRAALERLREHWFDIQDELISQIDAPYGVFEGRSFRIDRFAAFLRRKEIEWPVLPSGHLSLDKTAFRDAAQRHPELNALRELRIALSEMRLNDLAVGRDGRNRALLSAFRARTGRNQPSSSKFIFGPSVWLRSLIQAPPGQAVVYIDYCQQEFGIAAALSGDAAMCEAYRSGDPYLAFAIQAGACPAAATKQSHGFERDLFKACVLAVQYGMAAENLALRIGQPVLVARELLRLHHETYRVFWAWSDRMLDAALLTGRTYTVFGWRLLVPTEPNDRSLRNFPMQANGAEMLRLACCLATERGIEVCAPVHDAVLICAPFERLDADVAAMQEAMHEASRVVLAGFELRTDVATYHHPDRYQDPRGKTMWDRITALLDGLSPHCLTAIVLAFAVKIAAFLR